MSHIHIPDGVLPVWLWGLGWLVALVVLLVAGRLASHDSVRRKVPLLGIVSALMLVAMSSEIIPIAYHINLTVLGGILLGPVLSIVAAFIVGVVLAMLGHGGVTVLGLNTIILATEMVLGWALFRLALRALGRGRAGWAAGISTVITLAVTTTMLVGVVWLADAGGGARETGALDPSTLRFENPFAEGVVSIGLFSGGEEHGDESAEPAAENTGESLDLDVERFATIVYILGPIGWLLESLITGGIVRYVARVRPTLVFEGALAETRRTIIPGDASGGM